MTRPDDHDTAAIERLLANRSRHTPPPELRARVLAAVKKVPATKSGEDRGKESSHYPDLVAGTFWTALSLVLVVTLSSVVAWQRGGPSVDHPVLSFARRAEAAGIPLDLDTPSAERLARVQPDDTASPRHGQILHSLDARSLLTGDL